MTDEEFEAKLRESFSYDPETGKIFWKNRFNGKEAYKSYQTAGYRQGGAFGRFVLAHRVAWFLYYGSWPSAFIDHINGVRDDNRIENLRDVNKRDNARNQKKFRTNTSGVTGVSWHKRLGRWTARLGEYNLGTFKRFEDAVEARKKAEVEHGYFETHGRRQ